MTAPAARVAGLLAPARDSDSPDDELVRRFVMERDEHSFAALVRRHGPMVWGVCRRVLRDEHLAEDAFQAAFVVLARRAAAISPPGAVAGWLHGVAFRVAKDARRSALRRAGRERPAAQLPEVAAPPADSPDDGLRAAIDDELRRMPAKYRELLVACDLEGRARQPVAEALGIPEGTLSSRLTAARRMLARRLARRGVAPALAAAVAAGGPPAEAGEIPRSL
jgi:RNA polymerase sigma factor (sigma-70 family)